MAEKIILGLSIIIFVIYLIIFFILLEIKSRIKNDLLESFKYMAGAIITLIVLRITNLLSTLGIVKIRYSLEVLAFLLSLFLLMFFIKFYKSLCGVTDEKHEPGKILKIKK